MSSEANKRIAKNTAMLYIRMLFSMVVSIYTSRVVLNTLGVEDYGLNNVVGGIVAMFSFLNGAMASGTQRFLTYELGKKDITQLTRVFSMSMTIHIMIAIVIFVLAETVGLWFVNTQLTIPSDRMAAANWVYQFSVLSAMVGIWSVPYNAAIIAHERMNVYAYVSIIEVTLRLLIVFMLQWFEFDKLKLYAILAFTVSLVVQIIYCVYSKRHFPETKYRFYWNKELFKTIVSYAGWNLWGSAAALGQGQGINILLNIFFGPAVNASRAIAFNLKNAISSFFLNFQVALNPQIVKSYAANDLKYMHQLINQGGKFSFFLLLLLSIPILLETEIILRLWLKIVPEHSVPFTQLAIANALLSTFSGPLITGGMATGKIKIFQGVGGSIVLLTIPAAYLFLRSGSSPEFVLIILVFFEFIALNARLIILRHLIGLNIRNFFSKTLLRSLLVALMAIAFSLYIKSFFDASLLRLVITVFSSLAITVFFIYFMGLNSYEKAIFHKLIIKTRQSIYRIIFHNK